MTPRFPLAERVYAYERVRSFCEALDAEYRVFYALPAVPAEESPAAMAWLPHGFLVRFNGLVHGADRDHFLKVDPHRTERAIATVQDLLQCTREEIDELRPMRAAFGYARNAKAWAPDLVVSFDPFESGLASWLVSSLLDVPRVFVLESDPAVDAGPATRLLPLHLEQSALVVLQRTRQAAQLEQAFGSEPREKAICMQDGPGAEREFARRVRTLIDRAAPAAARQDLGPESAFVTERRPVVAEPETRPFVVLGAERTGSNLLVGMLASHPRLKCEGELFNPRMIGKGLLDARLPEDTDIGAMLALRRTDPAAFHRAILRIAAGHGAAAAGFKLLYYHGIVDNRVIDHLVSLSDLRVIHLTRRDRLARWLSKARADETDSWYVGKRQETRPSSGPMHLDPVKTLADLEDCELMEERARATFGLERVLEITYEDLLADPEGGSGAVLDHLGVEPAPLQISTKKQGSRDLRRAIANWEEIERALTGTRWSHLVNRS